MRTLIVCHYFAPEPGAPQTRLSELARLWSQAGDDVTILTGFPNHPTGVIPPGYRKRIRMVESKDAYRIVRTWLYATPNERILRKTIGHLSFMVSSIIFGSGPVGRPDVVIVSSPTFFSILSAWVIARAKMARFVIEIRDLWPEGIVAMGVLRSRPLIRLLEWIELASYRAADAVVVVSEGFRSNIVSRGIDGSKVHLIPNGVDVARFAPPIEGVDAMREHLGASDGDAVVLYAGTHGSSYDLGTVVQAARDLSEEHVRFAFVGDGAAKASLSEQVRSLGLDNVTLLPSVASDEVPSVIAAADICLVPNRDLAFLDTMIRAKVFEYLAAGKPVIGSLRGETAEIIRAGGGVVVAPEDPGALAEAIRALIADPERRDAIGRAARRYAAERHDRIGLAQRYRELLASLAP